MLRGSDTTGYRAFKDAGVRLGTSDGSAAALNEPAPDFTLRDTDGNLVTLSSLRGRTVLLNFWATWCAPCRREMPDINDQFLKRQSDDLTVLAINLQEALEPIRAFVKKYELEFPVVLDSEGGVGKAYRLSGLPESWIVDSEGILRERRIGAFTSKNLDEALQRVMSTMPSGRSPILAPPPTANSNVR
ncbi:MAG TPA: TlpA disulfide reductase family protein [Dehalococcoidia bacterium]|nr:TlpA disulfide reductase family protein [Dehalococcoidia bacterium]